MGLSRAQIKTFFETGDIPEQVEFADSIDSIASLEDTNLFKAENTHDANILLDDNRALKPVNGNAELNLRDAGIDGAASLTSDNNVQAEGFVLVRPTFADIGFAASNIFFDATGMKLASPTLANRIEVLTGGVQISRAAGKIGHFGAAPIVKPTVTGSRAGNAALASLLTALDNLGLITDSSTA